MEPRCQPAAEAAESYRLPDPANPWWAGSWCGQTLAVLLLLGPSPSGTEIQMGSAAQREIWKALRRCTSSTFPVQGVNKMVQKWNLGSYLVDLRPARSYSRNVEQDGAVLPEGPLLHIEDEANRTKVHVDLPLTLDGILLRYVSWVGGIRQGAFPRDVCSRLYRRGELSRAKNIRYERMIVQPPYPMRSRWLERVGQNKSANEVQVSK